MVRVYLGKGALDASLISRREDRDEIWEHFGGDDFSDREYAGQPCFLMTAATDRVLRWLHLRRDGCRGAADVASGIDEAEAQRVLRGERYGASLENSDQPSHMKAEYRGEQRGEVFLSSEHPSEWRV